MIKRIDNPFWNTHFPPLGWGCRCEVIQLPGKNHKETPDGSFQKPDVPPQFRENFGKKQQLFSDKHPYYEGVPENVKAKAENKSLNAYYEKIVKEKVNELIPPGGIIVKSDKLYSGEIEITRKDCQNLISHVPGVYKTYTLEVLEHIGELEQIKDGADKDHTSNKNAMFVKFNYYQLSLPDKTLFVSIGVTKSGKEKLYTVRDKQKNRDNTALNPQFGNLDLRVISTAKVQTIFKLTKKNEQKKWKNSQKKNARLRTTKICCYNLLIINIAPICPYFRVTHIQI